MTTTTPGRHGRTAIPADHFEHGDPRRWRRGCRCTPCCTAAYRHIRWNAYLRHTGRGIQRTPERAAKHITNLRLAGMSDADIQTAANIWPDLLYRILRGAGQITADVEQRVLSVPVPASTGPTTNRALIPATGTVRRLRALIAAGWYLSEIARRLEQHKTYIEPVVNGRAGKSVTLYFASKVNALYDQLANERPENHGLARRWIERARKDAAERDWRDPLWWEDWGGIDDPNAPETEPKPAGGAYADLYHRADEMEFLASCGMSVTDIAKRLSTPEDEVTEKKVTETLRKRRHAAERRAVQAAAEQLEVAA